MEDSGGNFVLWSKSPVVRVPHGTSKDLEFDPRSAVRPMESVLPGGWQISFGSAKVALARGKGETGVEFSRSETRSLRALQETKFKLTHHARIATSPQWGHPGTAPAAFLTLQDAPGFPVPECRHMLRYREVAPGAGARSLKRHGEVVAMTLPQFVLPKSGLRPHQDAASTAVNARRDPVCSGGVHE